MTRAPKKPLIAVIMLLFFLEPGFISAQEKQPAPSTPPPGIRTHILGDQIFSFSLGAFLPLFFIRTADGVAEATNLYVGAKASIEYMTYLSSSFALGGEIDGGMAFTPNFNIYWTLPITAKISYIITIERFSLFLSLSAGVNFQSFIGNSRMDFIVRPQIAGFLPIDPVLDLGVSIGYWFVPQIATAEQEANKPGQSRLANFLDISVSLIYHF